jgi:GTP-binding protein
LSAKVAIIGRPNVGKSTLFNRLVGRKLALVDDTPGVTRDRREGKARLGDLSFTIIDTAGLEEGDAATLAGR